MIRLELNELESKLLLQAVESHLIDLRNDFDHADSHQDRTKLRSELLVLQSLLEKIDPGRALTPEDIAKISA